MTQSAENGALASYAIACPKCRAAAGDPCWEWYCKNGYRGCTFLICARKRDLPEPHVARVARAAARVIPPVTSYPDMPCEDCEQGLSTCCVPSVVSEGGA